MSQQLTFLLFGWLAAGSVAISQPGQPGQPDSSEDVRVPPQVVEKIETLVHGRPMAVTATSVLKAQGKNTYGLNNLFDQNKNSAWLEGSVRFGEGDRVDVDLGRKELVYGVRVIPGYAKSAQILRRNSIPDFSLSVDGNSFDTVPGVLGHEFVFPKSGPYKGEPVRLPIDRPEHFNDRYYMLPTPMEARKVALVLKGVWSESGVDQDNGFSELRILTSGFVKKDTLAWFIHSQSSGARALADGVQVSLPDLKQACPHPNPVRAKNTWVASSAADLHQLFQSHYRGIPMGEGRPMIAPFFTRRVKNRYIITIDHNLTNYCYSDGEGGTQFVPEYHLDPSGNIVLIKAVPRPWPVP